MDSAKVTVLVAAYNASTTLDRCLQSLVGQTYRNIEIVCIDDASTDNTLGVLQTYAERDRRIHVVHRDENGGAARARNEGLKIATGDYIMFVDSDDYLGKDALEQVTAAFALDEETDCVLLQVKLVEDGKETDYPMQPFTTITGEEAFRASLTWQIHGVYAVRAAIHRRHPYDETCHAYSDDNTTRIHYLCSRFVRTCSGRYYYVQHADSVTHVVDIRRFEELRANESMRRQLVALGVDESIVRGYEEVRWRTLIGNYMLYYHHRRKMTAAERRHVLGEMRRIYDNIDISGVPVTLRRKFGYAPLRPFWSLFRIQEETYFFMRSIKERLF